MKRRSRAGGKRVRAGRRKAETPKRASPSKTAPRRSNATSREIGIARAFRERDEALEREKAAAEVLRVISSSPGDLQPVFKTILKNATRLCEANLGTLELWENDGVRLAASHGAPPAYLEAREREPLIRPDPHHPVGLIASTKRAVHVSDILALPNRGGLLARHAGARTLLAVPLLKHSELIGVINIYRREVRPFTEKQIALVESFATQAVIAIENTRLLNELRESLQQQTATSDVLKTISRSTFDLQTVLDALIDSAARLCDAPHGLIFRFDGTSARAVAAFNNVPGFKELWADNPILPNRGTATGRALVERRAIHIPDVLADPEYNPPEGALKQAQGLGQYRTTLVVPMMREGFPLGTIVLWKTKVEPFTDRQIELVTTFADQAAIAIENVRLFDAEQQRTRELSESLEQQTATSEVLQVISRSAFDLQPVFDSIAENAVRLCEAERALIFRFDGKVLRAVSFYNAGIEIRDFIARNPIAPGRHTISARAALERRTIHIPDVQADPDYAYATRDSELIRTMLAVPMIRDDELVGTITLYRLEIKPFTDKQVALVETFAAQAVIAIENTRLLSEQREALERQTATSDVLRVISSSPGELEPVFQAMLENATRICDANFGHLYRWDRNAFNLVAMLNTPPALAEARRHSPLRPSPNEPIGRMVATKMPIHVTDAAAEPAYFEQRDPAVVTAVELGGIRTILAVPLLKEGELIGAFTIYRQEVRPFTDKQIELVENFAAQAVIAIENTRLLNELRESLQQQTATADVLKVISRSTFDLQTVLNTLVESAARLCDADSAAIYRPAEGGVYRHQATYGYSSEFIDYMRQHPLVPQPGSVLGRAVMEHRAVHIEDVLADPNYQLKEQRTIGRYRTALGVPLMREGTPIGVIILTRSVVKPFSQKQIELATIFADQAAIAIENTRLFEAEQQRTRELSESLEQQTATSEVLKVISSSPGELGPVFEAILENATHICEAQFGMLFSYDGELMCKTAVRNVPQELLEFIDRRGPFKPPSGTALAEVINTGRVAYHVDTSTDAAQSAPARLGGAKSLVTVPMFKDEVLVGAIAVYRQEVRPFTDKQIELLRNFAAQAVIAIENTRLLNELRESLQQQTATAEVLKVISSSPGDLEPVFNAMLENAVHICDASFGNLLLYDGNFFRHVALHNAPPAWAAERERDPVAPRDAARVLYGIVETKRVVHIADMAIENAEEPISAVAGARTVLIVPMLKERELIGAIAIYRQAVRPFADKQIELVENFAAQAVIAIENTRLLAELRDSLQQQTATADVLKVISTTPEELRPVFDTILAKATGICEASHGALWLCEGDAFRTAAFHGPLATEYLEHWQIGSLFRLGPGVPAVRAAKSRKPAQEPDLKATRAYASGEPLFVTGVDVAGIRAVLAVPMLKDDDVIGIIAIYRKEVRPFTNKQIELVQSFAAQAVIAIENTRLLSELRESLEQQTATSDVLQVISSSPGELAPVFEAILANATRICEAKFGTLTQIVDDIPRLMFQLGVPSQLEEYWRHEILRPSAHNVISRVITSGEAVHVTDLQAYQAYIDADPLTVAGVELGGIRTLLVVPMLKDDKTFGTIGIYRQEVRPFTDKQIELVSNFAAQAAIAIENTRLLNELRQRTDDLGKSLDDLRTAQDRLVQTQKLASLGQLTAGIAHEIKNPLNFVNNFSGVSVELLDELQETLERVTADKKTREEIVELADTLRDNLGKIVQHGKRADSIVKNMLLHSREGSGERRPVDVNALVEESLNLAYHGARAEKQGFNVALERSFDPSAGEVDVFPQEITRVLLNLIANGFYAAAKRQGQEAGNGFEPTISAATKSLGDRVEIRIRDNGIGMSPEVREKMFNPFFTTKPAGEGTGLGLSISHDIIVKQHSGAIEVDTELGAFTEFRIILPRTAS